MGLFDSGYNPAVGGLLYGAGQPAMSGGQQFGNVLQQLGAGLLAYGQGGDIGDALRQTQGLQQQSQNDRIRNLLAQQQYGLQQQQAQRQAQADAQALKQRQSWESLIGGQQVSGPLLPGQTPPTTPVNPAFAKLPPAIQQMLPALDPDQGAALATKILTEKPQDPTVQTFYEGNQVVTKQWDPTTNSWKELSRGARWDPASGNANLQKLSLQPTFYTDASGKLQVAQLGTDGKMHPVVLPDGATLAPGVSQVDTGTGTTILNSKSGQTVGTVAKDVSGEASQKAQGTTTGTAVANAQINLPTVEENARQIKQTIEDIKSAPGLQTNFGALAPINPANYLYGTQARDAQNLRDKLNGQVFLQAYNNLKGGGQITEVEGAKATQALAALNNSQSYDSYIKNLNNFENEIDNLTAIARKRAAGGGTSVAKPDPFGIR